MNKPTPIQLLIDRLDRRIEKLCLLKKIFNERGIENEYLTRHINRLTSIRTRLQTKHPQRE